jgi:hypothetical protein
MIEVSITDEMIDTANKLAEELGILHHSIRKGSGNLAGFLGEECVLSHFKEAVRDNTYQHDILLRNEYIEVKTKDRTVPPKPEYECTIPNANTRQAVTYYFFVSLLREGTKYTKGYLLGYMNKKDFFERACFLKKGDIDPSNNFVVKADCWNLKIKDLHQFKT